MSAPGQEGPIPGRQARGALFFQHCQKLSTACTSEEHIGTLGLAVKMGKALVSLDLDEDPDFKKEMAAVHEAYKPANRPREMSPRDWMLEKRVEEHECIVRSVARCGAWKEYSLEWDSEPL